jgi:hypothetical protein
LKDMRQLFSSSAGLVRGEYECNNALTSVLNLIVSQRIQLGEYSENCTLLGMWPRRAQNVFP